MSSEREEIKEVMQTMGARWRNGEVGDATFVDALLKALLAQPSSAPAGDEVKRLRDNLVEYGEHKPKCPGWNGKDCNCGLDKVLEFAGDAPSPEGAPEGSGDVRKCRWCGRCGSCGTETGEHYDWCRSGDSRVLVEALERIASPACMAMCDGRHDNLPCSRCIAQRALTSYRASLAIPAASTGDTRIEKAVQMFDARVSEMLERHISAKKRGCDRDVVADLGAKWVEACEAANLIRKAFGLWPHDASTGEGVRSDDCPETGYPRFRCLHCVSPAPVPSSATPPKVRCLDPGVTGGCQRGRGHEDGHCAYDIDDVMAASATPGETPGEGGERKP